jgi:hypothetical protein
MNKQGMIIAIVVIVVLLVAIGFIWTRNTVPQRAIQEIPTQQAASTTIQYVNSRYGFSVDLPQDWKGYSIVDATWKGDAIGGSDENPVTTGPMISIRNPAWTSTDPHQDIPIMIFTLAQWADLQNEKFHIGAAPIGPSELGRNSKYVFALPARYDYAYQPGYEEVEQIIQSHPLHTVAPQ